MAQAYFCGGLGPNFPPEPPLKFVEVNDIITYREESTIFYHDIIILCSVRKTTTHGRVKGRVCGLYLQEQEQQQQQNDSRRHEFETHSYLYTTLCIEVQCWYVDVRDGTSIGLHSGQL